MDGTNGAGRLQSAVVSQPNVHRYVVRFKIADHLDRILTCRTFNETVAGIGE